MGNEARFDIISKVAEGGMSEIYLAYDKRRSEEVIIKRLLERHCQNRRVIRMFYQEARFLFQFRHSHILRVYEMGRYNHRPFVLMEYFKSCSLKDMIRRDYFFDLIKGIEILYQIGLALNYIHEMGVIHLDIKPANVLVNDELKAKLTDFGMARTLFQGKFRFVRRAGGTPSYMSPEQINGQRVDVRSDIYSFGVMAYEIFTHRLPFSGDNLNELFSRHMSRSSARPPSEFIADIPPPLDRIILRCLEKNKNDRYQDMSHLLADLSHLR